MTLPDVTEKPAVRGEPTEVADGVHVIADNRVPLVPNVGIVVGDRAALVIDTGIGPRNGEYVLGQARRLAGGRPLFLTTTHFHPEHGFGAQAFRGEATIIYNRAQRDELRRKGPGYVEMFKGLGPHIATALDGVELVEPDVVYDGEAELDLGGRQVTLASAGPAHTIGDQTVLIDGRVLFTGDLAETRMFAITPHFPPHDADVDIDGWIALLEKLAARRPEIVVPGHGEVSDVTLLHDVRDYLDFVRSEAQRSQGRDLAAATAEISAAARNRWPDWANPEWIDFAVRICSPAQ
ncbi:MBL fold metallo-hydrolase [Kutzneria buriramensis]|uniref:Glyoxylase-like metal-dependent hydrolase (Beta-lactamase superfamily II) n=1 Tax=Kutzneria buriramensis TaxID=1045776 RepID=A0A3E0GZ06_9PSEU|nr:MBL fold metallo-hydrolase [Kutzneria buriramensis]REH33037.1 glyoxylase-like metal-dependent hydrolase (beta-lactamase superfamily II) [Kutzneria buriramensis]